MARRAGKAASRKARQRKVQRTARPMSRAEPEAAAPAAELPPVGTPDAREAVSLDPPRRRTPPMAAEAGSQLSERQRSEYHYVERDLRSIGILTVVTVVLLLVAWFAFTSLGLTA